MHHLSIDIETYSSVPIGKAGLYKYAQSPDFEILLFAYSLDGAPVQVIDFTAGEEIPRDILHHLFHTDTIKHAYNAAFEWYCLETALSRSPYKPCTGWLSQWQDTMLHALYCGYPAGLEAVGTAMGLPEDQRKLRTGKALIKTFCTPRLPTEKDSRTRIRPQDEPEKWKLFKEYNAQDVITEMEIERRLQNFSVPEKVQKQWALDQVINARGVALDRKLMDGAAAIDDAAASPLLEEARILTGLDNPGSLSQLKPWLESQGCSVKTLRKEDVDSLLEQKELPDIVRRVLEIRKETSRTSTKKYQAMRGAICTDDRARGLLQFYGANRTGRWAGRLIQVQNLPRTYLHGSVLDMAREWARKGDGNAISTVIGPPSDVLSQLIRTAFIPSPGHRFVDADFSAIEARVIAWLAGEEWVLEVFRTHGKIYEATASQMFGVPIERIQKGNPEYALRQRGKVATLALGYQGGTGALINMGALRMGIPEEDLPDIVRLWRESNPRIRDLWYSVERAALETVRTCRQTGVRGLVFSREWDDYNDFLTILLPSGRKLYYAKPHLTTDDRGRDKLLYWGMNQTSHKWMELETYGGKLVENCVQAIARDCLAEAITHLEERGFPVVFHIHDEVVIDAPEDRADLEAVKKILSEPVPWAMGLPLNAECWVGEYFTKD